MSQTEHCKSYENKTKALKVDTPIYWRW